MNEIDIQIQGKIVATEEDYKKEFTYCNSSISRWYLESLPCPFVAKNLTDEIMQHIVEIGHISTCKKYGIPINSNLDFTDHDLDDIWFRELEEYICHLKIPYYEDLTDEEYSKLKEEIGKYYQTSSKFELLLGCFQFISNNKIYIQEFHKLYRGTNKAEINESEENINIDEKYDSYVYRYYTTENFNNLCTLLFTDEALKKTFDSLNYQCFQTKLITQNELNKIT